MAARLAAVLSLAGMAMGLAPVGQLPARPDFSGEWILDAARTRTTGLPARAGGPGRQDQPLVITEPVKIRDVRPVYPQEAIRAKIEGLVILQAVIDAEGNVVDLEVIRAPARILEDAAIDAVAQWKYRPGTINGVPAPIVMTVTSTFSLGTPAARGGASASPPGAAPAPPSRSGGGRGGGGAAGQGPVPAQITIRQSADALRITRPWGDSTEDVTYRFDGRTVKQRVRSMGGMIPGAERAFVSRWEDQTLVTEISWSTPAGPETRTERLSIAEGVLLVETSRPPYQPGAEPIVRRTYYTRRQQ